MSLTPVRKIKPSSRSITGKRSSSKTNVSQHFESTLERDFLTLLEYDDKVDDYGVQPITIHYENKGRAARYTPDMLVYFKSHVAKKPLLVEIKYLADLKKDIELLKLKFRAADIYARENGLEFNVLTEADIRTAYLINVKFLSKILYWNDSYPSNRSHFEPYQSCRYSHSNRITGLFSRDGKVGYPIHIMAVISHQNHHL